MRKLALHPIHGGLDGKTGARRKLSVLFSFFKLLRLRNYVDFRASDHVCVNNTFTKVSYERNTLSRVAEDVRMSCIDCWFCAFQKLVLNTGAKLLHGSLSSSPQSFHFTPHHMLDCVVSWPSRDSRISIVHHTALLMQTKHFSSLVQD